MPASRKAAPQGDQTSFALLCPVCGQTGHSVWDMNGREGAELVSLSMEFYERIGTREPYGIELVCRRCETVQTH